MVGAPVTAHAVAQSGKKAEGGLTFFENTVHVLKAQSCK